MKPTTACTLWAALWFAGCTPHGATDAPRPGTAALRATQAASALPPEVMPARSSRQLRLFNAATMPQRIHALFGDVWQFEPSVLVHPDGNILVTAADGIELPPLLISSSLWVSDDGGASFRIIKDIENADAAKAPTGAEGHVAIDAAGTEYFVDMVDLETHAVSRSRDAGRTWELVNLYPVAGTLGDRPWIAAGSAGTVAVAARQLQGVVVAVSRDGGESFPTQAVFGGGVVSTHYHGEFMSPLVMGRDDRIFLAGADHDGIWIHRSDDLGLTFDARQVAATVNDCSNIFAVPAVDAEGGVYVTWVESTAGESRLRYAYSTDHGASWSAPIDLSASTDAVVMPWAAGGEGGVLAVAYYISPGTPGNPNSVQGRWHAAVTLVEGASSSRPAMSSLVLEPVAKTGPVCTRGSGCAGDRELGDLLGVAIASNRDIHLAWSDAQRVTHWAGIR